MSLGSNPCHAGPGARWRSRGNSTNSTRTPHDRSRVQAQAEEISLQGRRWENRRISLYDPSWHQGVVGILAGRVKDRTTARPSLRALGSGEIRARALDPGLHLRDALDLVAKRAPGLLLRSAGTPPRRLTLRADVSGAFAELFETVVARAPPSTGAARRAAVDDAIARSSSCAYRRFEIRGSSEPSVSTRARAAPARGARATPSRTALRSSGNRPRAASARPRRRARRSATQPRCALGDQVQRVAQVQAGDRAPRAADLSGARGRESEGRAVVPVLDAAGEYADTPWCQEGSYRLMLLDSPTATLERISSACACIPASIVRLRG